MVIPPAMPSVALIGVEKWSSKLWNVPFEE
jgi:hypothetical protein